MHIEAIAFTATQAAVAGSSAAAVTGDSLTIKQCSQARILAIWAMLQADGFVQIVRQTGNDTTRDLRWPVNGATPCILNPIGIGIPVQPTESLTCTLGEANTSGDIANAVVLVDYDKAPGYANSHITPSELVRRGINVTTVQATLACGTAGGWSGAEILTAETDLLKPNSQYAILGVTTSVACAAIGIRAPDWSNSRVAVPGDPTQPHFCGNFFLQMAKQFGDAPIIPTFAAANRSQIWLDGLQDENGADPVVTLNLVQLR
jgi:hypothetical protein